MTTFYDRQGKVILNTKDVKKYVKNNIICKDYHGGVEIATYHSVIDLSYGHSVPPILFETWVFGGQSSGYHKYYKTELEAREGHNQVYMTICSGLVLR